MSYPACCVSYVELERRGPIAIVTINRPERLNALNSAVVAEIGQVLDDLDHQADLRAVVLTGAGERAFIAGGDVAEMHALTLAAANRFVYAGQALTRRMERLSAPIIAAVNGFALGGGTELALACDLRIASESAVFGLPEVSLGLLAGWGGTQRLLRTVGRSMASELILTGRHIAADEALRIGLVSRVVPRAELLPTALSLADAIAANSPAAVRQSKKVLHQGADVGLDQALTIEAEAWLFLIAHPDRVEGTAAFLEKRKPTWPSD
jgi:enoyl-CoA hydratase/carnithine racemase